MNWLSQEEIKRRAEISEEEALDVSIEHWEQICEAIRMGESISSHYGAYECGFCQRIIFNKEKKCEDCVLHESNSVACCQEWRAFDNNSTLPNAETMLNRLYQEKGKMLCKKEGEKVTKEEKPKELQPWDYGKIGSQIWIKIYDDVYWLDSCRKDISAFPDSHFVPYRIDNLANDLERNSKDLEGFEVDGLSVKHPKGSGLFRLIAGNNKERRFTLDETQEIHQKLGQLIATAKRRKVKDC